MISLGLLFDAARPFWVDIYKTDEAHWIDKKPSNLTKYVCKKFGPFNNLLEVGCAAGIDTFILAQHTKNKVVAIDIVPKAIQLAKENLKHQPEDIQKKIIFEVGNVENLKYPDKSFGYVYSLSVLHSTDINKSLKEIRRVLVDGGKAAIYVYVDSHEKDYKPISEEQFVEVCEEYFTVTKKETHDVSKDAGGDKHTALIVYLETK